MPLLSIAFLIGTTSLIFLPQLPNSYYIWPILIGGPALIIVLRYLSINIKIKYCLYLLLTVLLGFSWTLLRVNYEVTQTLPNNLSGTPFTATGYIASLPEIKKNNTEFEFIITNIQINKHFLHTRISWRNAPHLQVGNNWQFTVQLKKPRGFWDTNSFDYQEWLFERGITATGYVIADNKFHLIPGNTHYYFFIDRLRQKLAESMANHLYIHPLNGLIAALAVGVRDNITEQQWNVLRGTGTNHLFAIAGLHIGFASGIIYGLISFCWCRLGRLPLYLATPQAAALGALLTAIFYSALAGFALPTQRAVIMIAVFLAATLSRRNLPPWHAWNLALLLILLFDPLATLSASFWLSFGAVALIIYGMTGRIKKQKWWQHWGRIQWVVAIGLIPLSLLFFHQASLANFIANAIAIPWVGFITLPLSLLGDITWLIFHPWGIWIWTLAEYSLQIIWPLLSFISSLNGVQWIGYINNYWILISASIAILLLLAPRGFPARRMSIIWALPILFWTPTAPKINECWFTLLDVGQGLAAIIQTKQHTLVYDTGPDFSDSFDAGNAVVIPFLQSANINLIDTLVISNSKNEHMGGVTSVLQQIPVQHVLTTVPEFFKSGFASYCAAGQTWQWDNIKFTMLYPPANTNYSKDSSCVLRIDDGTQSILLTSDINDINEKYLVQHSANLLPATILIAPHSGSQTSSTPEFIQAVHPQIVLFSVGDQNRYGYPALDVLSRYQTIGAKIYSTAQDGSITFKLTGNDMIQTPKTYQKNFWDF